MLPYILRRLVYSIFVVLGLTIVVFVVTHLLGDAARLMLPVEATEAQYQAVRAQMGLDRPLYQQLAEYLWQLVRGDFGESTWQHVPAMQLVLSRFPATLYLTTAVMLVAVAAAIPMGIVAAVRPHSWVDRFTSALALAGISTPTFWVALVLIAVLAVRLGWFKTSGYGGLEYLVLPVLSLCIVHIGRLAQVVRAGMVDELNKMYLTTARSKGLSQGQVVYAHALRNAALPIITVVGDEIAGLVNGAVVIEVIFAWPGIGLLAMDAIQRRDFPIIQADVILVALAVIALNLMVDIAYAYVDPRIRYG
jgi:peptide/nickel transport system permease protein